jgi:2-dehydropantoate 2-reductase
LRILVFGAGVIGSLYAARLQNAGHDVVVIARGERQREIERDGLVVEEITSRARMVSHPTTTTRLDPTEGFDLALVTVRLDQLDSVLPQLAANRSTPTVLFLLNNPVGSSRAVHALGEGRGVLGFPGAGGSRDRGIVRFELIAQQPTMVGELNGQVTERVRELHKVLVDADFRTTISRHMDAWLATHGFFVASICGGIYLAGGDCRRLSQDRPLLELTMAGIREGFRAVRANGLPIAPFSLKILFTGLPRGFASVYWRRFFATDTADHVFGRHARAASEEMRAVARECRTMLARTRGPTPALDRLFDAVDAFQA